MENVPNCFLIATNVAIETSGQVGVRSAIVGLMSRSGPEENINFRGLNASIFVIFFFTTAKILRRVHFFA